MKNQSIVASVMRYTVVPAALVLMALLVAPSGCSRASHPSLKITAPIGNSFALGDITVSVEVSNLKIVDKQGQAAVNGEGHLHYFMDVDAPTAQGQPAVTDPGTYVHTTAESYTWHNVGGGSHSFSVELVNNDHTPLNPPVVVTQSILVVPEVGLPQAVILAPRNGAVLSAGDITITTQVSNFNLVDKLGQPNVSHEGHLIYFMDVNAGTVQGQPAVGIATAQDSYTWTNVKAGMHTFIIELVNNDHSLLDPPVVQAVTIKVQ